MKFFDLFAGIGGFRVGLESWDHECIGSCEIDKYARQIYAKNFGHEPEYKDARDIDTKTLPSFDILCAGFPCQSFSIVGNRLGFEDKRGNLFFEIARIAREKQPSYLLLENVKGLLSHEQGNTFKVMLQTLDELGYDIEWQLLNSKYFVPQSRERLYIIGHLRGSGRREVLPIGSCSPRNDKSRKELYAKDECSSTLTATYWKGYGGGRPMISEPKIKLLQNSSEDTYRIYSVDGIARTLRASSGGLGSKTGVYAEPKIKRVDGKPNVYNTDAQAGKVYDVDGISPSVTGQRINSQGFIAEPKKVQMNYKANTNANMKERVQDRDTTWTLTGNSNDFTITDNHRVRRLTPIECERLQGFKDDWTKGVSDTQRYKMLGNAVTTKVVEYIVGYLK